MLNKEGYYYIPYEFKDNDYRLIRSNCKLDRSPGRFYGYLLENLEKMLNRGKTSNVQYEEWHKLTCNDINDIRVISKIKLVDFWFENNPPSHIPIVNFYRTNDPNYHNSKIKTYEIIKKHYGTSDVKSLPKYFFLKKHDIQNITFKESEENVIRGVIRHVLEILKKEVPDDQLKQKPAWVLKDSNSSVGEGIFGFYLFRNAEMRLDETKIENMFVTQIVNYFNLPKYTAHYKKISNIFLLGYFGDAEWMICEFIDSVKIKNLENYNVTQNALKDIAPYWNNFFNGSRLKLRAYFCPIIEYDSVTLEKHVFGWLYPNLDVDYLQTIGSGNLENDMWDRTKIISNESSGIIQEEIQRLIHEVNMLEVDDLVLQNVCNFVKDNGYDYVHDQIKEICKNVILPEFQLGCTNDPKYYNKDVVDYARSTGKTFKCFNITALDLIIDENLNVYFLEINTSPVVQKYYPDYVYGGLYTVAIDGKHDANMIYLDKEYLPVVNTHVPNVNQTYESIQNTVKSHIKKSFVLHNNITTNSNTRQIEPSNIMLSSEIVNFYGVHGIVKSVLEKEFTKEKLIDHNLGTYIFDEDELDDYETFVDLKRQYKAISTDLVTNNFFYTIQQQTNFIYMITQLFDSAIKFYCKQKNLKDDQIIFIFKGGMVLRMLYKQYVYEMPGIIGELLDKLYGTYFKKSDADFEILIDPKLENFDDVKKDITNISYLILDKIRTICLPLRDLFFNFYKLNFENQTRMLYKYMNKMENEIQNDTNKNSELFGGHIVGVWFGGILTFKDAPFIIPPSSNVSGMADQMTNMENMFTKLKNDFGTKNDFIVTTQFPGNPKDKRIVYDVRKLYEHPVINKSKLLETDLNVQQKSFYTPINDIYLSYNDSLSFESSGKQFCFNLVRMKTNFQYVYEKNNIKKTISLPGEMIDVSIVDKTNFEIDKLFEGRQEFINKVTFVEDSDDDDLICGKFSTNIFSIKYFCKDIENMLYYKYAYPWLLEKYKKRLIRLLFLYSVDMLKNFNSPAKALEYINLMKNSYILVDKPKQSAYILRIEELLAEKICNECMLIRTFHELNLFLLKLKQNEKIIETREYIEYSQDIINFFQNITDVYDTLNNVAYKQNFNVNVDRLQNINMKTLTGGRKISLEKFYE